MIAYLDTPSGISGDMFLGCLVDAGWSVEALRATVAALHWPEGTPADGWAVEARSVMKGPLRATRVLVRAGEVGQPHRHLSDVRALLEGSALPAAVQRDAEAVFLRLAQAEGAVHGMEAEAVHFHEVGALDSIIDIVGTCAGLHALRVTALHAGPLPIGPGTVNSQHGPLPLPAPATLELLVRAQAPVRSAPGPGELVTPTGAALVAHFVGERWGQPEMRLRRAGIGAGGRDFPWPNVARLWLGEPLTTGREAPHEVASVLLETNIDDMNPELYPVVAERLFAAGARDVWWSAIGMKKNRPGVQLSVLALRDQEATLAAMILRETTTLGMRVLEVRGYAAERRMAQVETTFGPIPVKLKLLDGAVVGAVPEFEACRAAAQAHAAPARVVYEAAAALAWQTFLTSDK